LNRHYEKHRIKYKNGERIGRIMNSKTYILLAAAIAVVITAMYGVEC